MVSVKPSVLIVDDEQVVCDVLCDELTERGYLCTAVPSGNEALARLAAQDFEVTLLDIRLPGMSGMEVLREIWSNHSGTAIIMITAVNDVDTASEAMKLGAADYIVKPFNLDRVATSIRMALETRPATDKSSARMDAIARGVEARLDSLLGYSRIVAQETIGIARQLDIPAKEIQRWLAITARDDASRNAAIASSPYQFTPKPDESQN